MRLHYRGCSPSGAAALAFSLQAPDTSGAVGMGAEFFGPRGSRIDQFTAVALTLQIGSFPH